MSDLSLKCEFCKKIVNTFVRITVDGVNTVSCFGCFGKRVANAAAKRG